MSKKRRFTYILLSALAVIIFAAVIWIDDRQERKPAHRDYEQIKKSGELTILTLSASTSYFTYRDEPMGYHYDMAKAFCEAHGLKLQVKTAQNISQLLTMLHRDEGDLIAYPIFIQSELKDSIIYCGVSQISHQVLVQRSRQDSLVKDVVDLIGRRVTVQKGSKHHQRIENLDAELGGGIIIDTHVSDSLTTEDLIEMVSNKEIDLTLSDEYLARLNKTFYRNINISLPVSFEQRSSWVVSSRSPQLAKALDEWFTENEHKPSYTAIAKKYFELSKQPLQGEYDFRNLPSGHVSPYDSLFQKHAQGTRFQWQLLAAISYQESRFKNGKTSWAGAAGIMGLMPGTAKAYGISSESRMNPDASVGVAIKLIKKLDQLFQDVDDPDERTKFVLASYNGGIGHISDIRALAEKYGSDKTKWEGNVRNWVTKKRDPQYFNDPVCKNGYFRGTETLNYVDRVLEIKNIFKTKSDKNKR